MGGGGGWGGGGGDAYSLATLFPRKEHRCKTSARGAMDGWIDPSWWTN